MPPAASPSVASPPDPRGAAARWWIYQRERFPVFAHGSLILAFSSSAVCFSALLGGAESFPPWPAFAVAFVTCFLFFLQLRIADEFKDAEEDRHWRPYRPVPRGLVRLRDLGVLFALAALVQLALALWLDSRLAIVLVIAWAYLALMSREFFAREWLKARPITYLWTHMLIMPLVDLHATATEWIPREAGVPPGLGWFLAVSFGNGLVIELGRKIRAPGDEEEGVPTYSRLWGAGRAPVVWLAVLTATALLAARTAWQIDFFAPVAVLLVFLLVAASLLVTAFRKRPCSRLGHRFETLSGLWTIALYLVLGIVPMLMRWLP